MKSTIIKPSSAVILIYKDKFEIETNVIGIDTSRSNYVLHHKEEANVCIELNLKFFFNPIHVN